MSELLLPDHSREVKSAGGVVVERNIEIGGMRFIERRRPAFVHFNHVLIDADNQIIEAPAKKSFSHDMVQLAISEYISATGGIPYHIFET